MVDMYICMYIPFVYTKQLVSLAAIRGLDCVFSLRIVVVVVECPVPRGRHNSIGSTVHSFPLLVLYYIILYYIITNNNIFICYYWFFFLILLLLFLNNKINK